MNKALLEKILEYKKNKCDGVIAFGGGSGLDVGKAIAFMSGPVSYTHLTLPTSDLV